MAASASPQPPQQPAASNASQGLQPQPPKLQRSQTDPGKQGSGPTTPVAGRHRALSAPTTINDLKLTTMEILSAIVERSDCGRLRAISSLAFERLGLRMVLLVPTGFMSSFAQNTHASLEGLGAVMVSMDQARYEWIHAIPGYSQYWNATDFVASYQEGRLPIPARSPEAPLSEEEAQHAAMNGQPASSFGGAAVRTFMIPAESWSALVDHMDELPGPLASLSAKKEWQGSNVEKAVKFLGITGATLGVAVCAGASLMAAGSVVLPTMVSAGVVKCALGTTLASKATWLGGQLATAGPVGSTVHMLSLLKMGDLSAIMFKTLLMAQDADIVYEFWRLVVKKCSSFVNETLRKNGEPKVQPVPSDAWRRQLEEDFNTKELFHPKEEYRDEVQVEYWAQDFF